MATTTNVKPADFHTRSGLERSFDYEPSWVNAPFESFNKLTQQQFQDTVAPFQRHGAKIPIVVPEGWRRVETSTPGQHVYVHMETGTISRFPKEVYSMQKESWSGAVDYRQSIPSAAPAESKPVEALAPPAASTPEKPPEAVPPPEQKAEVQAEPATTVAPSQLAASSEPSAEAAASDAQPVGVPAEPPLPVGLLFPGQGSQYVGMLKELRSLPEVKALLKVCDDVLDFSVIEKCLDGPDEELERTDVCQPAMFTANAAAIEKLRGDKPDRVERVQSVAGLSLGEYSALYAAGVFDFETGLRLVKKRGQLMQEAAQKVPQKMASVAGLDREKVLAVCAEARGSSSTEVCTIANSLFPEGYTVAGTKDAIQNFETLAKEAGAMQVKVLKTGGAFHTSLMSSAQLALIEALEAEKKNMKPPRCTVYMNTGPTKIGPATPVSEIVDLLGRQIISPVEWDTSMKEMVKDGVTEFYECGPMKQLKAMMKRIDPAAWKNTSLVGV